MLFKHQYLEFAYVDIVLMVSKMFRGNLTADMLAIGVTVVLISEIATNCCCLNLIYFKHVMIQTKYVMLQMEDYQGDEIQKGI